MDDIYFTIRLMLVTILLIAVVILLIRHAVNNNKCKRYLREVLNDFPHLLESPLYPVYFSLPSNYFGNFSRDMMFSGVGYIEFNRKGITIYGRQMNGRGFLRSYSLGDSMVEWVGRNWRYGGNVNWFLVNHHGKDLYISGFTGYTIIGSKKYTRDLFGWTSQVLGYRQ